MSKINNLLLCWGKCEEGQLGVQINGDTSNITPKIFPSVLNIKKIVCGDKHTIALSTDGTVYSSGSNEFCQLGRTGSQKQLQQISTIETRNITDIACGYNHTLLLDSEGQIFGFGDNRSSQLSCESNAETIPLPRYILILKRRRIAQSLQNVVYIACGYFCSFAINNSIFPPLFLVGVLYSWGSNEYGELGIGSDRPVSTHILDIFKLRGCSIIKIAGGFSHVVAISHNGYLYAWGNNSKGQAGRGNLTSFKIINILAPRITFPAHVKSVEDMIIIDIACGSDHTVALSDDGRVFTFGFGRWGQLGHGQSSSIEYNPRQVIDLAGAKISHIMCGRYHTVVYSATYKRLYEFGVFHASQCGDAGSYKIESYPKSIAFDLQEYSSDYQFELISSGGDHNIILFRQISDVDKNKKDSVYPLPILRYGEDDSSIKHSDIIRVRSLDESARGQIRRNISLIFSSISCLNASFMRRDKPRWRERVSNINFEMFREFLTCINDTELEETFNKEHLILHYSDFYVNSIQSIFNIGDEYLQKLRNNALFEMYEYSFLFDLGVKTMFILCRLLWSSLENQYTFDPSSILSVEDARRLYDALPIASMFNLVIRRSHLLEDTLNALEAVDTTELKSNVYVTFEGEEAQDEGGVRKEFYLLLIREIFKIDYGLFSLNEDSQLFWFPEFSLNSAAYYTLIGLVIAVAIYNNILLDIHFPLALYEKLLDCKPSFDSFLEFEPILAKNFLYMLEYEEDDFEDIFPLTFQISRTILDKVNHINLIKNGKNIKVTQKNKHKYVEEYINYVFNVSCKSSFKAFYKGFYKMDISYFKKLFNADELQQIIIGSTKYDFCDLKNVYFILFFYKKSTEYRGKYHQNHPTIKYFWEVVFDYPLELKRKFLKFTTGSDRLPICGIKTLNLVIQPMNKSTKSLPVAHTCFNILDLPPYKTKELLEIKLTKAIENCEGFGLV
ncbi:hypothetical protein HZS_4001 [Henneguya salminicola]|nr:hypothetical protein HZS_4001 [Henneguya salminicola]